MISGAEAWIGRREERRDTLRPWPAEALHETLDRSGPAPQAKEPLPPLWRRLYFPRALRRADLAVDGGPERGEGLTPPMPQPRRIAVAGRLIQRRPLLLGASATLVESVAGVAPDPDAGSDAARVTVRVEAHATGGAAFVEEEDILYRSLPAARPLSPPPAPPGPAAWRRVWSLDQVLLFRAAALFWDAERSAYDLEHCRETEDVDGLIPPLPLLAILMLDLARERGPDRPVARFAYTRHLALTHRDALEVCAAPAPRPADAPDTAEDAVDLWIASPGDPGRVAVSGRLVYG